MTYIEIVGAVLEELERAEKKHPVWPKNRFEALAVLTEEVGELNQAVLDEKWKAGASYGNIAAETVQVAAMSFRFLKNLAVTETG